MGKRHLSLSTLAGAGVLVLGLAALAPASEAEAQAARSRSSASPSGTSMSRSTGSSTSGGRAAVSRSASSSPRSTYSGSRGAASTRTRTTGTRPPSGPRQSVSGRATYGYGGHHGHYYRYPYYPYYGHYYRYPYYGSIGLGWWGGYYYPYFHYSYYGYPYSPYYYPPAPSYSYPARIYADPVGAFDLDVKPKKTQVWVDGRMVGTAGKFDGFPDYLWLSEGEHQLVFFLEGYQTVERKVETVAGVVGKLRLDMVKGQSTPVSAVIERPPPPPPATAWREPAPPVEKVEKVEKAEKVEKVEEVGAQGEALDVRSAPGRLVVKVEPDDASVYLDGRFLGTGRDLARLHAGLLVDGGDHTLEIVRPGYDSHSIEISVEAGEEEIVEVGLEHG